VCERQEEGQKEADRHLCGRHEVRLCAASGAQAGLQGGRGARGLVDLLDGSERVDRSRQSDEAVAEDQPLPGHERDLPQGLSDQEHEPHGQNVSQGLLVLSEVVVLASRLC